MDVDGGEALDAIGRVQEGLENLGEEGSGRAAGRGSIHFTLKFIGEVGGGEAAAAGKALEGVRFEPFAVHLAGVGAFPSASRPRAVWAGVDEDGGRRLAALAADVGRALGPAGPAAGEFRPHATIYRIRDARRAGDVAGYVRGLRGARFGPQRIGRFKLRRSAPGPGGAVHTDVLSVGARAA